MVELTLHFPDGRCITKTFHQLSSVVARRSLRQLIETGSVITRKNQYRTWNEKDAQYVRDNWNSLSSLEIAQNLNRSRPSVMTFASKVLNIKKPADYFTKEMRSRWQQQRKNAYTPQEKQYLRDNWQTKTVKELATDLGRTCGSVKVMGQRTMRLKKSYESMQAITKRPNAGQFKKGQLPKNTVFGDEMTIRVRHNKKRGSPPYQYIRTGFKRWQELHRWLWEQHNGPIPKGYIVTFINGDSLDARIENLQIITLKDNANRNHNYEKSSATMRQLYKDDKIRNPMIDIADKAVANWLFKNNPEMRKEILNHPEVIELKRNQIKLNRLLKNGRQGTSKSRRSADRNEGKDIPL